MQFPIQSEKRMRELNVGMPLLRRRRLADDIRESGVFGKFVMADRGNGANASVEIFSGDGIGISGNRFVWNRIIFDRKIYYRRKEQKSISLSVCEGFFGNLSWIVMGSEAMMLPWFGIMMLSLMHGL